MNYDHESELDMKIAQDRLEQWKALETPVRLTDSEIELAAQRLSRVWGESVQVLRDKFEALRIAVANNVEGAKELSAQILSASDAFAKAQEQGQAPNRNLLRQIVATSHKDHSRKMQKQLEIKKRRLRNKGKRSK